MYKYEDWKKRLFIDFNEHDILEFCGGKSAKLLEWSLCNMQYMHIKMGIDLAHTLALINLYDLNYLREDITEILGNCDVSFDAENLNDADFLQDRVKIHSKNKGIRYKRSEILFNLLCFEKNIDNASKIVGLSENQINKFIERNSMFKSDDEKSFLDKNKLSDILNKWKMEVFVESWILEKIYDDSLKDYCELTGLSEEKLKEIYEFYNGFKEEIIDLLKNISLKLMKSKFDFDEIEQIVGLTFYNMGFHEKFYGEENHELTNTYYFDKYLDYLKNEVVLINE